jgi:glycosyltransferase involved in cell wall biosynthesis
MKKKIAVVGASPLSLINFRGALLKSLGDKAEQVVAMASEASADEVALIEKVADRYLDYPVARNGLNPLMDLLTLWSLKRIFTAEKPEIVFAYTIKPIIWGGLAARMSRVPNFFALVTGLGFAFQSGGVLKNILVKVVSSLYRIALKNAKGVIFQNVDNMNTFIRLGIVGKEKCHIVNGSGVDLSHFSVEPLPTNPKFLLIARLLADKGIREYCKAAALVKQQYPNVEFHLLGPEDPSPNAISVNELQEWINQGILNYHGVASDVRPFIKSCSIFVLPSYHEGMPRTVLEAMAMGRPILTTNVPGCRDTVIDGVNGWLVEKADVDQLAERMMWFIQHPESWQKMGAEAHKMAIDNFDVKKVNAEIIEILGVDSETVV